MMPCPCGSGQPYSECCQRFHAGDLAADTPEALMRSRYSAFVMKLPDYLRGTWHPTSRPASLPLEDSPDWAALQILSARAGDDRGQVHFRALYRVPGGFGYLEEVSDFVREDGRWFYLSGTPREGRLNPGRNDRCPCGSGRKFKTCCLQ